jgi:hypothetical protein
MNKASCLALWLILLTPVGTAATQGETLLPGDFSNGFALEVDARLPYFDIEMPTQAYRLATDPELRDVAFFAGDGRLLRHFAVPNEALLAAAPFYARTELPLFPVARNEGNTNDAVGVTIAANGALITLPASTPAAVPATATYVIDASVLTTRIDRFEITIAADARGVMPYAIDGSADLQTWNTLIKRANLVRLEH